VATLQKENEELKTKIAELESRESQVEAGVVETLQKENEALKEKLVEAESRQSRVIAQERVVKRLEHRLGEAQIVSANWEKQVSWGRIRSARCDADGGVSRPTRCRGW
jgi:predicted RNase H-like nuclease (RuvC/YqgF family)